MKLVVINGPCGVGKSTLAKRVQDRIPMAVLVEMDDLRRSISHYKDKDYRKQSGFLMFELTLGIIERALKNGSDVIVDKIIFNYPEAPKDYLQEFARLAEKYGAEFHEFILRAKREVIIERAADRGFSQSNSLTMEKVEEFYDAIERFIPEREGAQVIDTSSMAKEDVFDYVWNIIHKN